MKKRIIYRTIIFFMLLGLGYATWYIIFSEHSKNLTKRSRLLNDAGVEWKLGNPEQAILLYEEASILGDPYAKDKLIHMYANGIGTEPNREKALFYLAELNDIEFKKSAIKSVIYDIKHENNGNLAEEDLNFWQNQLEQIENP